MGLIALFSRSLGVVLVLYLAPWTEAAPMTSRVTQTTPQSQTQPDYPPHPTAANITAFMDNFYPGFFTVETIEDDTSDLVTQNESVRIPEVTCHNNTTDATTQVVCESHPIKTTSARLEEAVADNPVQSLCPRGTISGGGCSVTCLSFASASVITDGGVDYNVVQFPWAGSGVIQTYVRGTCPDTIPGCHECNTYLRKVYLVVTSRDVNIRTIADFLANKHWIQGFNVESHCSCSSYCPG